MQNPHKILIVEDDDAIAETMSLLLIDEGFQTHRVNTPASGVIAFDSFKPDVILLDCLLSGGVKPFVSHVRQNNSGIPIVLVTAITAPEAVAQTLEIKDLLRKPFNVDDLLSMLRNKLPTR